MYKRSILEVLKRRFSEPRRFIQVLAGPRQAGKTTLAQQLAQEMQLPSHYASADTPMLQGSVWIAQQWEIAREMIRPAGPTNGLLVLDEIQKVPDWDRIVKAFWDEDTRSRLPLHIMLLGSSPLLMQKGLSESLAGRFEIVPVPHWSYDEMRVAFGWDLGSYLFYGGFPGAATLVLDHSRWSHYIRESLIETTVSRDILLMARVDKPALLRRLFDLACHYSGQILSFQKMLGQLQDAGNATTLAHYLRLLQGAGLVAGVQKYARQPVRRRASSPKLVVLNNALITATAGLVFEEARTDRDYWGRLVESAVGAHLCNQGAPLGIEVYYWLDRNQEVDFILKRGKALVAVEVKSGRRRAAFPGLGLFLRRHPDCRPLLVGTDGIPLADFLSAQPDRWF